MTPTRALMAVRVWLRAIERISVRVFGIFELGLIICGRDIFARCGVGMIFRFNRQEKCYDRKIRCLAADATRARNEADDFRAHDIPSHTAIATRNTSASEIRYAVIHC
jgi:hypothetical protein